MALSCAIVRAVEETGLDMVYPSPPSPQVPSTNVLIAPLTIEVEEDPEAEVATLTLESGMGTDSSIGSSLFSPTMSEASFTPNGSKSSRGKWTSDEDEVLRVSVLTHGGRNWKKISEFLEGRTDVQCLHRWQKVLRPGLVKGPWTKEEDDKVVQLVDQYGVKSWSFIARKLEGRLGKQCRERWYNHLNPDINKQPWSEEEDRRIIEEHDVHGNKWAEIAKNLPGRTDNAIKNRWNSTLQRLLRAPPSTKKVKAPRVKKISKKNEKAAAAKAAKQAAKAQTASFTTNEVDDNDTDSICLSVDMDMDIDNHHETESCGDTDDTESSEEGRTTTSSSCSESSSPIPTAHSNNGNNGNMQNLTLINQMKSCTEVWQQKQHLKKQKKSATKCSARPFSPDGHGHNQSGIMSPLDALLIAADSSFTCLKNASRTTKKKKNSGKDSVPCSPSILRRRSPQKAKQPKNERATTTALSSTVSHLGSGFQSSKSNSSNLQTNVAGTDTKLHQLAMLSAAPTLSGSISLKGEEFCMSPTDVKRSEVLLLSPYRYQHSIGEESPTKRRKLGGEVQKHTENISVPEQKKQKAEELNNEEEDMLGMEESLIAQSLLRMKTAHALVGDFY